MFNFMFIVCCRSTRESTPCSLIRDPDTIRTPGSTTRPTCSTDANRRTEHAARRQIPTSREMDEFFAEVEEAQQRKFIEKYALVVLLFFLFLSWLIAISVTCPGAH